MSSMLPDTIESVQSFDGTNQCFTTWSSDVTDKVRVGKLDIIFTTPGPRLRRRFSGWGTPVTQEGCPLFGQPQPRGSSVAYLKKCNDWSIADSRAAARARLACRGTAKTAALAVTNQSSFSSLMADLKENFDTKDENSSGVLLHEYLNFTMTENNTQDHCISYGWTEQQPSSVFFDLAPSILYYNWF